MLKYVPILLLSVIVPTVLNVLSNRSRRVQTSSIYHFDMRPGKGLSIVGVIGAITFSFCLFLAFLEGRLHSYDTVFFVLLALSILLILSPVKGFWDAAVDGNDLTSSRLWIVKKKVSIPDIRCCIKNRGGFHIYEKNKKRKTLSVDGMCTNTKNLEKRLQKEGIDIQIGG